MNVAARKLRRELFNIARQMNLSGWFSFIKLVESLLKKGSADKLTAVSAVLAHFPRFGTKLGLTQYALSISRSKVNGFQLTQLEAIKLSYCIVVKPFVSYREKGFILVSFENQLQTILNRDALTAIQERYYLIFIPSWTGLYSPALFELVKLSGDNPIFILPVHEHERNLVKRLGKNCVPLPFNAASWVNQEFFVTHQDITRDIDCLIVANFGSFKRHWLLFSALKKLPKSVTAVCVGIPIGSRTAQSIRDEANDYGVSERVKIIENPSQEDLRLYFQRSKVFCAMSYREGSFIAVAEALMSGTPVVMFSNAHIGTKSLLTPEVGALVDSVSELRDRILEFMNFEAHDRVRQIAKESTSAQANCKKLNDILSDWSHENGHQWTSTIVPFYSMRLSFFYLDEEAKKKTQDDYQYLSNLNIKINVP